MGRHQVAGRGGGQRRGEPHGAERGAQVGAARPLLVAGGIPLQQPLVRYSQAPQGAQDGIQAVIGLMGQGRQAQAGQGEALASGMGGGGQVLAKAHVVRLAQQVQEGGQQRWDQQDAEHRQGPEPGGRRQGPCQQQQGRQDRRHQAAAQVVEQLPARQQREGVGQAPPIGTGHPRQQPGGELPVAANPAVAAVDVSAVAGRILLIQGHVAQEPGAGVAPLQEVVAQDAVLREAPMDRLVEGGDVVDALADERALPEHVLVDVRDGAGVGVYARLAAVQAPVARVLAALQARAHAGLEDAVAGDHALPSRVVDRPVQRVRHGPDERSCGVARQLGVRIQGDDVAHPGEDGGVADHQGETPAVALPQQGVEVRELAALALVTHPDAVVGVPAARAMEQKEDVAPAAGVARIQTLDALPGQGQQGGVLRQRLLGRVAQVGQEAKMQVRVAIGQEPHLQCLDQSLDVARTGEHGRDHHQGARLWRDALGEVHARQPARRCQ